MKTRQRPLWSPLRRLPPSMLATLDSFLVLGALGVYIKSALLQEHWDAISRFMGKPSAQEMTSFERLGFFCDDIVLNLLVVPVVATIVLSLLRPTYRLAVAFGLCSAMSLFYFVDLRAQSEVGQYISVAVLGDLVGWAASHGGVGGGYVTPASVIKLAALLMVLLGTAAIALIAQRRNATSRYALVILTIPATVVMGTALMAAPVSYSFRQHDSPMNVTAVGRAVATFFETGERIDQISTLTTVDEALQLTRQLTRTAPFNSEHPFVGREQASDLIIFMMETGPALALDPAEGGRTLPGVGPLLDRAFIARQHYTTHPYSSDALYSILSGLYPQGRRQLLRRSDGRSHNALMTALEADTGLRAVYVPSLYQIGLDHRMYLSFGAQMVYAADTHMTDPLKIVADERAHALIARLEEEGSRFDPETREMLELRLQADFQALERTKADIVAAVQVGSRYSVLFFPEIGHAPWFQLRHETTVLERGRTLMLLQDQWLKEIVDTVRNLGRLEQTVIAVTADHGIRTRVEDPALQPGRISDYTFRVPLVIYAPRTLQQTKVVTSPSSHVDFAPTLLALLGKVDSVRRMQGVPVWDRRSSDRLYLLASTYGGADGFMENGTFYMYQSLTGTVYRSSSLPFKDEHLVTSDPVTRFVTDTLTEAQRLQYVLASRMSPIR